MPQSDLNNNAQSSTLFKPEKKTLADLKAVLLPELKNRAATIMPRGNEENDVNVMFALIVEGLIRNGSLDKILSDLDNIMLTYSFLSKPAEQLRNISQASSNKMTGKAVEPPVDEYIKSDEEDEDEANVKNDETRDCFYSCLSPSVS